MGFFSTPAFCAVFLRILVTVRLRQIKCLQNFVQHIAGNPILRRSEPLQALDQIEGAAGRRGFPEEQPVTGDREDLTDAFQGRQRHAYNAPFYGGKALGFKADQLGKLLLRIAVPLPFPLDICADQNVN